MTLSAPARQLVRQLDQLAGLTDEPGRITRTFLSPAMRQANSRVSEWMREAGLSVKQDAVGNVIGRLEAAGGAGKTLLLGSHLDTVRDAGRFDGPLGVLLPIIAVSELQRRQIELPFAIEVLGFSEEEGVRFSSAYLGSKGYTGRLRASDVALKDVHGTTVRQAIEDFTQTKYSAPVRAHQVADLLGYLEVHIEQGPVLEAKKLAVGVVSAISGQTRGRLTFCGKAGHAGTTPMNLRRDALAGAAEMVLFAEQLARAQAPLVATVGTLVVAPGAPNVIPGEVSLSLDVRHPRDVARRVALKRLLAQAKRIARSRKLTCEWEVTQDNGAVTCSPRLSSVLDQSVRAVQKRSTSLVSGAGHDAVAMSTLTPVSMLFVRCREGLSHHPDEFAAPADLEVALRVTIDFIERMARLHSA